MKLAAILIGIVAGAGGLLVALMAEALIQVVGGGAQTGASLGPQLSALFYGPPSVMLAGAVLTILWPIGGGALLLLGAAAWLVVGFSIATLGPIALAAIAGILALVSARRTKSPATTS